jgi:hypothetical protein
VLWSILVYEASYAYRQGSRILSRVAIAKSMGCGTRDLHSQIHITVAKPYKGSTGIGEWGCDVTTPAWRLREEAVRRIKG